MEKSYNVELITLILFYIQITDIIDDTIEFGIVYYMVVFNIFVEYHLVYEIINDKSAVGKNILTKKNIYIDASLPVDCEKTVYLFRGDQNEVPSPYHNDFAIDQHIHTPFPHQNHLDAVNPMRGRLEFWKGNNVFHIDADRVIP